MIYWRILGFLVPDPLQITHGYRGYYSQGLIWLFTIKWFIDQFRCFVFRGFAPALIEASSARRMRNKLHPQWPRGWARWDESCETFWGSYKGHGCCENGNFRGKTTNATFFFQLQIFSAIYFIWWLHFVGDHGCYYQGVISWREWHWVQLNFHDGWHWAEGMVIEHLILQPGWDPQSAATR